MPNILTENEIKEFAENWYKLLDVHAPITDFLPMLDADDLEMVFPEATLKGAAAFSEWLAGVVRIFFDEEHTVKEVTSSISTDGTADVKVVVNWKARRWQAPAATADKLDFDAYQTWIMKRSESGAPVIVKYIVDDLKALPGSAAL